jgi:hypothetical protein
MDPTMCYPDNNGMNGGNYTIDLVVNDTGFQASGDDGDGGAKNLIQTENDAPVTLTLTNMGTTPHGFAVGCISVCSSYSTLPAGCSPEACFPTTSAIPPLAPGATMSVTFVTPTPDGLIFPFSSNEPNDTGVQGLNMGQWSLM